MYSRDHAIVSVLVGLAGLWALSLPELVPWWAALGWAVAVGVGIDFDHFLIARLVTGEWTALRRVAGNPLLVVTAPDEIFEDDDLWAIQRLLSHAVLGGVLVGGLLLWSASVAVFTALVLYAHVLADLVWDNYNLERYHRRHADYVRQQDAADGTDAADTADADAELTRS